MQRYILVEDCSKWKLYDAKEDSVIGEYDNKDIAFARCEWLNAETEARGKTHWLNQNDMHLSAS